MHMPRTESMLCLDRSIWIKKNIYIYIYIYNKIQVKGINK